MRNRCILLLLLAVLLIGIYVIYSRHVGSTISESGEIDSRILGRKMCYSVYLPPGYHLRANRERKYPVLYLLHGFTGDHTIYPRTIGIQKIADKAIRSGEAVPMIIVMPQSRGGIYSNSSSGTFQYEDYFFQELIPCIEKTYRVQTEKENRAVAGHSMGGNGTLLYALKHPEMFASCCAIGAAIEVRNAPNYDTAPNENDLAALLRREAESGSNVRFYIDCGKEDGLIVVNEKLHHLMLELGIPHEYRVGQGGHTWEYWREAMPGVLKFTSETFTAPGE